MIPKFPKFKLIELNDKNEVEKITSKFPPYSDFNFTSMWSWNLIDEIALSVLNGNLVVRFTDYVTNSPFYSFIGDNKVNETCEALLKFTISSGLPPTLRLMPEISLKGIDEKYFAATEDRGHFDYVYNLEDLRDFPGSKFKQKRNHTNGFLKKFSDAEVKTISLKDPGVADAVLKLFEKWQNIKAQKEAGYGLHDLAAMKRLLQGVNVFDLVTVGIYLKGELVALFINQLIDSEYVLAHMMKADTTVDDGLYTFLMQKNAEILVLLGRKLFNYEQDLGIENLRIAKSRFNPSSFLKKYMVGYVNKEEQLN